MEEQQIQINQLQQDIEDKQVQYRTFLENLKL